MSKRQYIEAKSGLTLTYHGDPYPVPAGKTLVAEAFRIREGSEGAGNLHPESAQMCALAVERLGNVVSPGGGRSALVRTYVEYDEPAVTSTTPAEVPATTPTVTDIILENLAEGVAPAPFLSLGPVEIVAPVKVRKPRKPKASK